jgi:broad specificity phosphatase PhoE
VVAAAAHGGNSLIVAHGGALRQSLALLTGDPDPGSDLPTGSYAVLQTGPAGGRPRLVSWPAPATDR